MMIIVTMIDMNITGLVLVTITVVDTVVRLAETTTGISVIEEIIAVDTIVLTVETTTGKKEKDTGRNLCLFYNKLPCQIS